jgi:FAD/FMN-containing dehydrogenase
MAWVKSTRAIVEPYLSGSYINYIDSYLEDWEVAYYGENYERLVRIKNDVDGDNFFHFNQSVGLKLGNN